MALVQEKISDWRLIGLVKLILEQGILEELKTWTPEKGVPQGAVLSPVLSNLMLDDLDRELTRRGLRFVRYADDCNIYVRSQRAGERVKAGITRFLTKKLKLKVNESKSAVARPSERKFLGFTFLRGPTPLRRIAPKALAKFKERIRELTRRARGVSLAQMIQSVRRYVIGWRAYFGFCETQSVFGELDGWIRRRLRSFLWKQWKRGRRRYQELVKRGLTAELAAKAAKSSHGPWQQSRCRAMCRAFPNEYFHALGLPKLEVPRA